MSIKKILGCIAAAGMSIGGLILAGKSEFGKGLGEKPEPEYDPDDMDMFREDAAPEESGTETEAEPESEE